MGNVITTAGLTEKMNEVAELLLRSPRFESGEGSAYSGAVAEATEELTKLPEGLEFSLEYDSSALGLYLMAEGLKVEVFWVYLDSFSREPWACKGYAEGNIFLPVSEFVRKSRKSG